MPAIHNGYANVTTPLLDIQHLSIAFQKGSIKKQIVHQLSLQIMPGEAMALIGKSGSGKTVTALSILRLLPSPPVSYPEGDITFCGHSLLHAHETTLRKIRGRRISMIFQDAGISLNPLHRIEKQLTETLMLHRNLCRDTARNEILQYLDRVGIRNPKTRLHDFPHQFSGGERQRIMIAMAVLTQPYLLIADEPTTALDVSTQTQLLTLLNELKQELNMSLLVITHNVAVVKQLADKVTVIHEGHCVESSAQQVLLNSPAHTYSRQLLNTPPAKAPSAQAPLLQVKNLCVSFNIRRKLLRRTTSYHAVKNVSFTLHAGVSVGLIGESGCGKSSTALALLRLLPSTGEIWFEQTPLHTLTSRQMLAYRSRIQMVFQDPSSALNPKMTALQIIAEGLKIHQKLTAGQRELNVITTMQQVGLDPVTRYRYPAEFSGGERQRIAIARALILQPQLLILDEPTASLDKAVQSEILNLLKMLQQQHQLSYLFISHDLEIIRSFCQQVIILHPDGIVQQGESQGIFTRAALNGYNSAGY